MDKTRVEAFSDGVLAIAITLLVLDLAVPAHAVLAHEHTSLAHALGQEWPSFAAYLVSFLIIGIIWVNHHAVFGYVRRVDRRVLFANLALLLFVSVIPFPTRLVAEYLRADTADARTAVAIYSTTMLAVSVCYTLLWLAVTRDAQLLAEGIDPRQARAAVRRFGAGLLVYAAALGLCFVIPPALILLAHFGIAVYYCFDQLGSSSS